MGRGLPADSGRPVADGSLVSVLTARDEVSGQVCSQGEQSVRCFKGMGGGPRIGLQTGQR